MITGYQLVYLHGEDQEPYVDCIVYPDQETAQAAAPRFIRKTIEVHSLSLTLPPHKVLTVELDVSRCFPTSTHILNGQKQDWNRGN